MEEKIKILEKQIEEIQVRNKRVEREKAWETSYVRALSIIVLTYVLVVVVMLIFDINRPFVNAVIPTLGYFLSIQSLPFIKSWYLGKF